MSYIIQSISILDRYFVGVINTDSLQEEAPIITETNIIDDLSRNIIYKGEPFIKIMGNITIRDDISDGIVLDLERMTFKLTLKTLRYGNNLLIRYKEFENWIYESRYNKLYDGISRNIDVNGNTYYNPSYTNEEIYKYKYYKNVYIDYDIHRNYIVKQTTDKILKILRELNIKEKEEMISLEELGRIYSKHLKTVKELQAMIRKNENNDRLINNDFQSLFLEG